MSQGLNLAKIELSIKRGRVYCSSCGAQLSGVGSFCSICGSKTMSTPSQVEDPKQNFSSSSDYQLGEPKRVNPWETFFTKQGDFKGRANRAEFWVGAAYLVAWSFVLFFLIGISVAISEVLAGLVALAGLASGVYLVYLSIVLYIRRFHDMSMSGLWILLYLLPFAGWVIFFIQGIKAPAPANQFGPAYIS